MAARAKRLHLFIVSARGRRQNVCPWCAQPHTPACACLSVCARARARVHVRNRGRTTEGGRASWKKTRNRARGTAGRRMRRNERDTRGERERERERGREGGSGGEGPAEEALAAAASWLAGCRERSFRALIPLVVRRRPRLFIGGCCRVALARHFNCALIPVGARRRASHEATRSRRTFAYTSTTPSTARFGGLVPLP